jgi:phospholipase C
MVKACSFLAPFLFGSLAACSGGSSSTPPLPPAISSGYSHVIVVIQENRSFDNIFAGARIKGADVATSGYNSICSDPTVVTTCGQVPLVPLSFNSYGPDHSHATLAKEWNNGLMNGFDHVLLTKTGGAPYFLDDPSVDPQYPYVYAYLPPAEIHPYVQLATTYSLSDHMFSSGLAPSFPGHVFLVAGRGPADDPLQPAGFSPWGCPEVVNAPTETVALFDGTPVSPCFDLPTIADLLDAKGVSWKYYIGQNPEPSPLEAAWEGAVNSFAAIDHIYHSPEYKTNLVARNNFFSDVAAGTLPAVSWITPNGNASDHANIALSADGPYWVSEIYEAIAQNPSYYGNTAIIVTWDDSGAWYDHVPPPAASPMAAPYAAYEGNVLGMRVPLLFIAANARQGVSQTVRSFGSILGFIEHNFGLGNLNAQDVGTDALADLFNPKPGPTIAPIPRSQLLSHARRPYSVEYFRQQPETPADDQ